MDRHDEASYNWYLRALDRSSSGARGLSSNSVSSRSTVGESLTTLSFDMNHSTLSNESSNFCDENQEIALYHDVKFEFEYGLNMIF